MRKSLLTLIIVMAALSGACLASPQSAEAKWAKANQKEVNRLTDVVGSLLVGDAYGQELGECQGIDEAATKLLATNPPAKLVSGLRQMRHGGEVCSVHDSMGGIPYENLNRGNDLIRSGCEDLDYEFGAKSQMECS